MTNSRHATQTAWLFTASVMLLLCVRTLMQQGMFMDAVLYTSVSHNMARGLGSFWFPYFDAYNIIHLNSFHEQPPLVFGIQSLFFRWLGDSMYVERFYVLCTLVLTAWGIAGFWKELTRERKELQALSWLTVLLWITIPVAFWSYSNNMHENTMGLFTLAAVRLLYRGMYMDTMRWHLFALAGFMVALAFLSKGFPGFFPVTIPFVYALIYKGASFKRAFWGSLITGTIILLVAGALYVYTPARESLSIYLFQRAFERINHAPTVDSRFFIVGRLFSELIPAMGFTLMIWLISGLKSSFEKTRPSIHSFLFLFLCGCCGSLPLMLTRVQNGFYFVPALPYFGLAFAWLTAPAIQHHIQGWNPKMLAYLRLGVFTLLLISVAFVICSRNSYSRDEALLKTVDRIATLVPPQTRISCTDNLYVNWDLNCYLVRFHGISLSSLKNDSTERNYILTTPELTEQYANNRVRYNLPEGHMVLLRTK